MTRSPSLKAVLRGFVDRRILPADAEISKAGSSMWQGADFYYVLSLDARGGPWALWSGDLHFRALEAAGFGGVRVKIQSAEMDRTLRELAPEALDAELTRAIEFVHDREDLCQLLMSPGSVVRGSLEVWQMIGNFPARLAQALLVSRDLGREDLEEGVRRVLDQAPSTNAFGKQVSATQSARRWLKEYANTMAIEMHL